jgi:hypothetical protein
MTDKAVFVLNFGIDVRREKVLVQEWPADAIATNRYEPLS